MPLRILRVRMQTALVLSAAVLFCAVCAAFAVPLSAAVLPVLGGGASRSILRIFAAARFTLIQALLSAFAASGIGLCAAFFCARREFFGRKWLMSLSAVPLSVPPVVIALAFILFFGKNGMLNKVLLAVSSGTISTGTYLYSLGGVLLVHSFYNFPIAMRTVAAVWAQLPEETEQAAYLLGASPFRIFRTVTFPALKAPLFASFLIIFLYCFFSFVIILLLGGLGLTTLEVELYQAIRRDVHSVSAAWIALIETGIAAAAVYIYLRLRSKTPDHTENTQYRRQRLKISGAQERLFFTAVSGVIVLCLILPLASLFVHSLADPKTPLGFQAWKQLLSRPVFWTAVYRTVQVGIGTAALSVTAALFFAYRLWDAEKPAYRFIPFIPFTVSSIIIGSGWLRLDAPPSVAMLIAAQASLAWPFAWTQIEAKLAKIPHTAAEAARLFSASRSDAFFRVILPLCKTGIASAFCSVFAVSAGDASLPLILHIPDFENLALLLFRFAGAYRFAESAAIALVLAVLTGLLFFIQDSLQDAAL